MQNSPQGREYKTLGEVTNFIRNGKSCKQNKSGNGDKITRIETIYNGKINEESVGYFSLSFEDKEKFSIKKGDILFSHINSIEHVGKVAISKKDYSNLFHGMNLLLIRPNSDILDEYLFLVLNNLFETGYRVNICKKAINQASLNQSNIINLQIPIPPIETQKKIVEKLDETFEDIDKSIQLLEKNIQNIDELNKSTLNKVLGTYDHFETVKNIAEKVQYGYTGKISDKGNVKYLRITDIQNNKVNRESVPYVNITEKEIEKYSLNEGDLVFARTGATVGKSFLIDNVKYRSIFASYLIRLVPKKEIINPNFLYYFLRSDQYWNKIYADVVGSAQPNFNGTKLKNLEIPLPSLEKQKEIVEYLDKIFETNQQLKQQYQQKLQNLQELKKSTLNFSFEGKLV